MLGIFFAVTDLLINVLPQCILSIESDYFCKDGNGFIMFKAILVYFSNPNFLIF